MPKNAITQKRLKELLHYDPETGIFTWNRTGTGRKKICGCIEKNRSSGYRRIKINGVSYFASRLAFMYMNGKFPEHLMDHINRIRHDDRWCNLREVDHQGNSFNKSISSNNTSGRTGVIFYKDRKKWGAQITIKYKKIHLGFFDLIKDAIKARKEAEEKLFEIKNPVSRFVGWCLK